MAGDPSPKTVYTAFSFEDVLDEYQIPIKNKGLTIAQNVMYRRAGSYGKRTGSAPYGAAASTGLTGPVRSGVRWYRGKPTTFKAMVLQCGDALFTGNDATGAFSSISGLTAGSSACMFASVFDPAESAVAGTPASDILAIACGSMNPQKWDGTNFTQLSASITQKFTGVSFWHEHLWWWGDPGFPDYVFASDLGAPESFAFSNTYGGYQIGRGDGDPTVQICKPNGPFLYAFKNESIYAFQGYDFVVGEYQFQLEPAVFGIGTTCPFSVQVLNNKLIWWSGQDFWILGLADAAPTRIGTPIVKTIATAAMANQSQIRSAAGDFLVQTSAGYFMYTNVYLFAFPSVAGGNDTILVYDGDAAQRGKPAWTIWKGLNVGAFIPWGGPGDNSFLYYGDSVLSQASFIGGHPTADQLANGSLTAISYTATTGRDVAGASDRKKRLDRVYLDVESNAATFEVTVTSDQQQSSTVLAIAAQGVQGGVWGQNWGTMIWGSASGVLYQSLQVPFAKTIVGYNFTIQIYESSTGASYEVVALSYRAVMEGYRP